MKRFSFLAGIIATLIGLFLFIHPFTTTAMIGWIIAIIILALAFFTPIPTVCLVIMAAASGIIIDLIKSRKKKEDKVE